MIKFVVVFVMLVAFVSASVEVRAVASYSPGFYRSLTVVGTPSIDRPTAISVRALGIDVNSNSASIDSATFTLKNPDGANNGVGFYFGYFSADASWNPNYGLGGISAALAEVFGNYMLIAPYYDRDSEAGFQWNLGDELYCSSTKTNKDCLDNKNKIEISKMTFSNIVFERSDCPDGYAANCSVYTFTAASTDNVFKVDFHLASEPVLINGVTVRPNYGKIDITINYNWQGFEADFNNTNPKLALMAAFAGRVASGGAIWRRVANKDAIVFAASADKNAYFSWDDTVQIGGSGSETIHHERVSGDSILDFNCANCNIIEVAFYTYLKLVVGAWQIAGWKLEFVFFSVNSVQPATVFWDPAVGLEDEEDQKAGFSAQATFSYILLLLSLFAAFITRY